MDTIKMCYYIFWCQTTKIEMNWDNIWYLRYQDIQLVHNYRWKSLCPNGNVSQSSKGYFSPKVIDIFLEYSWNIFCQDPMWLIITYPFYPGPHSLLHKWQSYVRKRKSSVRENKANVTQRIFLYHFAKTTTSNVLS